MFQQLFQISTVTSRNKALSGKFFQRCGFFYHLDQDMRQVFGVRRCKILCHTSFCVDVLHVQQLLMICDQLHTVSVCMRFRSFWAGAIWASLNLKPVQLCVLSVAFCGFPARPGALLGLYMTCLLFIITSLISPDWHTASFILARV